VITPQGRARLSDDGHVVIPAKIRKALGLHPGDHLVFQITDEGLLMTTIKQRIGNAQRRIRKNIKPGTSLVEELIAERRVNARKELE